MASATRARLSAILLAVRDRLTGFGAVVGDPPWRFTTGNTWIALRTEAPQHDQADQYALVMPLEARATGWEAGGGRNATAAVSRLAVYFRGRRSTDQEYRDTDWLAADDGGGALDQIHGIIDALQMFRPLDASGNGLVIEPLRWLDFGKPRKEDRDPDWGEVAVNFECKWLLNLNTAAAGD